MATKQFAIAATGSDSTPVPLDPDRRYMLIQNYVGSSGNIYVVFGGVAYVASGGSIELVPGAVYTFGGPLPPSNMTLPRGFYLPNCPPDVVHVISNGTASGCIITQ